MHALHYDFVASVSFSANFEHSLNMLISIKKKKKERPGENSDLLLSVM